MSQLMPIILVMSIILGLIFVFMYLMRSQQQQPPPPPAPPTEIIIEK
jgi:flagellar biogenesis protein FliO